MKQWFVLSEYMPYFICDENLNQGLEVGVSGDEVRHILLAHRSKKGEVVKLQGPNGKRFNSEIVKLDRNKITLRVLDQLDTPPESKREIILFQSVVSEKALDFIFQKGTELGLSGIVLYNSQNTATKLTTAQFLHKKDRWERILVESAKQCERVKPPQLEFLLSFEEVLNTLKGYKQVLHADMSGSNILTLLPLLSTVAILVGPEGGFTQNEMDVLRAQKNILTVSLGPNILRAETAALALTSILNNI